jgi:cellulose synthase/poly-beta-1,6-N-acetylglucosamine synthase-like glycosyltransferase
VVPRVSILLPVRDAEATLAACLRSIVRQTDRDWECVLVDDGSLDASLAVARTFAAADARIRVVDRQRLGLVAALNAGLAECRGPLLARMDADDWMHRERLAAQRAALDGDPRLAAVGSHVRLFPRAALGAGMRAYERWLASVDSPQRVREEAFVECPVAHPTLMLRTRVLRSFGYRDAGWPEDYDLVLRLLEGGLRVGVVPRRLLYWRHGPRRLSRTSPVYEPERFTACKAAFLARSFLASGERYLLWGYGGTGRALHRALQAHGKRASAIVELHPGRLGNRIHGAPVIPPDHLGGGLREPLVVSVAGDEARGQIRARLAAMGYRETQHYVCAA